MKSLLYIILLIFSLSVLLNAEEIQKEQKDEKSDADIPYIVKTKEGLIFRVPEDMPIEKRGGIVAPVPFNEYVSRKLKLMNDDLNEIKVRLDKIEGEKSKSSDKKELVS